MSHAPTATLALSPQQLGHFRILGYLLLRQVLQAELGTLRQALQALPCPGDDTCSDAAVLDHHPSLRSIVAGPHFQGIAEGLLGTSATLRGCTGRVYRQDLGWHNDSAAGPGIRLHAFTDNLAAAANRFMLIPGSQYPASDSHYSHLLAETLHPQPNLLGLPPDGVPGHVITAMAGDIIVTDHGCEYGLFRISGPCRALLADFSAGTAHGSPHEPDKARP